MNIPKGKECGFLWEGCDNLGTEAEGRTHTHTHTHTHPKLADLLNADKILNISEGNQNITFRLQVLL